LGILATAILHHTRIVHAASQQRLDIQIVRQE
jgi:hypothetical protein